MAYSKPGAAAAPAYAEKQQRWQQTSDALNQSVAGQGNVVSGIQGLVGSMPGELDAAKRAGLNAIRAGGAQSLSAQGARGASMGAGGFGAMGQAGLQGGIQAAQFGANATIDKAKTMQGLYGQLGEAHANYANDAMGRFDFEQDAIAEGLAPGAQSQGKMKSKLAGQMHAIFDENHSMLWDDDEEAYEAGWDSILGGIDDPEMLAWALAEKAKYDQKFYFQESNRGQNQYQKG